MGECDVEMNVSGIHLNVSHPLLCLVAQYLVVLMRFFFHHHLGQFSSVCVLLEKVRWSFVHPVPGCQLSWIVGG